MRRTMVAFVVGALIGAGVVALILRDHRTWQEQEARSEAQGLACSYSHGLGVHCANIAAFHQLTPWSWQLRLALDRITRSVTCFAHPGGPSSIRVRNSGKPYDLSVFRRRSRNDSSLARSAVVDSIAVSPDGDTVGLSIIETRPWDGGDRQLDELAAKLNAYARYILGGQLEQEHPDLKDKQKAIILHCLEEPPSEIREVAESALARHHIRFEVWPLSED